MPEIILKNITKRFGKSVAVDNLNLVIKDGDFVSLLGPSGCGKTTTLRMIAGLETPTEGEIYIDGKLVFSSEKGVDVSPDKRNVGFLFQNYALFPNMTVEKNILCGVRSKDKQEKAAALADALRRFRLEGLEKRYPAQLSGGQKRRADKLESTYKQTISFPYLNDPRLDSVLIRKGEIRYYYTQTYRPTKDTKRLHLFFRGRVDAIDRSRYDLSNSDTLTYTVTSMLSLLDNKPRYMLKIIDKYVEVRDRNYITFPVGRANVIDTMGQNHVQLDKIERLMDTLINQYEFFVDSITITASSSPDGSMATNNRIAGERARSIKERLVRKFGHEVDTLIRTRSIGEDWTLLKRLIRHNSDVPNWEKITDMIDRSRNLDVTEQQIRQQFPGDYAFMKEILYPQLRAVDFRYNLRRVDMVKDTVVLTVLDTTYMRGVQQLRDRDYVGALRTLNDYKCQNLAIVLLSLSYDEAAFEILEQLPPAEKNPKTDYLSAIALSRMNRPREGLEYYLKAIQADPVLKFRGNLDPEIQILYKQNNVKSTAYDN